MIERIFGILCVIGILTFEEYRLYKYKEEHIPLKIEIPESETHPCVRCGQPNTIYFYWIKDTLKIQKNDSLRTDSILKKDKKSIKIK